MIILKNGTTGVRELQPDHGGRKGEKDMDDLIAYFSRANENYVSGELKKLKIGTTERVAEMIREITDADMFHIEMKESYPKTYNECIDVAKKDQKAETRPELRSFPESIDEYKIIYLGYPNYWGTMPMAVFTFLEHFDFSGKIIRPFCTHEGSGLGGSVQDIKKICKTADVQDGLAVHGSRIEAAADNIRKWVMKKNADMKCW